MKSTENLLIEGLPKGIAKRFLAQNSVSYENVTATAAGPSTVTIGDKVIAAPTAKVVNSKFDETSAKAIAAFKKEVAEDLKVAQRHALLKAHGHDVPVSLENG